MWRPNTFTLVVDYLRIKFEGDIHANHIAKTLKKHYDVTTAWKGELFVGIKLKWDLEKRMLDTHIPTFVSKSLHRNKHPKSTKPQNATEKSVPIQYGVETQVEKKDTSPGTSESIIKHIQDVVGTQSSTIPSHEIG